MAAELPAQLDVLAIGAHPDDVEIGCGGTLAKLAQQGYAVGIIDLTDGEPTPKSAGPHARIEEARQAACTLGAAQRITLDLPNRRLFDSFESRLALAKEFRRYRPRLVIGLGDKTPLASPDHYQAVQITDAAVFYSRLSKWEHYFDGLPVHSIAAYLYYTLNFAAPERPLGAAQIVIDISGTLETKLAAVRCYGSQFPPEKHGIFERIRAQATLLGAAAGYTAGETLSSPRALGTTDLMQFLFGSKPTPAIRGASDKAELPPSA